jgi:ABC-type bacteriocin/lantibiotic exporter with double-glycine peptidase domain
LLGLSPSASILLAKKRPEAREGGNSRRSFHGNISLEKIEYRYPNSEIDALIDISLEIQEGELIAIVGPSGAGKSTLADVILGLLPVASGRVTISGLAPDEVIRRWPGIFGYVPQDVLITNGTVRENVALGFDPNEFPDKQIWDVLQVTSLEETVAELPKKLDTRLGDRGGFISGGQRQRLGIARALFTKPGIIVLDEATSALDGETEADISNAISALKGKVTVLLIAHRLSTVRNADRIYYLDGGHLVASGNFEQLRKLVPDFDSQASLMGL